jgi:DNA-binding LacI/PurR family transcriptional regulator
MSVTFKDVAALAGVSTQTVSRVTNGSSNVADDTRKKVLAAIEQLNYIPNKGAQLLSRAKSKVIGLITLDIGLHGVSLIANGIRRQAYEVGYGTLFSVLVEPNFDSIIDAVRDLKSQKTDKIILNIPVDKHTAEQLVTIHPDIHFVFIDVPQDAKVHSVCADHYQGGCQAANLLLELKRNQMVFITGPNDSSASERRVAGWSDTLAEHNVQVVAHYEGDWQADSGYLYTRQLIADGKSFDSILVAGDQMALGVLRALAEFNYKVPEQVSVIGFDDLADCAYFSPPLTTIRQEFSAIGQIAVDLALDNSEQLTASKQEIIATTLIQRKSTAMKEDTTYDKSRINQLLRDIEQLLP